MTWHRVLFAVIVASLLDYQNGQLFENEDRTRLLNLLTDAEKYFLFGPNEENVEFNIVNHKHQRRRKRHADIADHNAAVQDALSLQVVPRHSLVDPKFLLVRRWRNKTESVVELSHEKDLDNCFFRSENAALFMCGDVRGVVTSKDGDYYSIHPLPDRFHTLDNKVHVIVKRSQPQLNSHTEEKMCHEKEILDQSHVPKIWTKYRRKRGTTEEIPSNTLEEFKLDFKNKTIKDFLDTINLNDQKTRVKRAVQSAIFVETAVFIDRDLYKRMAVNFPTHTERELVRFVLAMINAVQLLYNDPSLGKPVNFILKRLEILHEDPSNLKRPHDIDRFLSNFCTWQRLKNPPGDSDPLHWDHALILTGLDLYVVSKAGKVSSQVVGLAPVAGMCTVTSSCTVNEGRHFESVYVVAHEIGHNLGMRHDGPQADNGCDPSAFIMSPTLGSGKITWSSCSRNYLQKFLDTVQSHCLLDHANSAGQLDHGAEGILPGERFDGDQQCMLKYGSGSRHSAAQSLKDVCRDLHCQRERYTWTSHPALEGTRCGDDLWCRAGECVPRAAESPGRVRGPGWGRWSDWGQCASGCLYGEDGRLASGSTGIAVAVRRCTRSRKDYGTEGQCDGADKKYQTCSAQQCLNVPRMTVGEFSDQLCSRARQVDPDLIGTGLQRIDPEDGGSACAVWCHTRGGGYKSRGWSLPDGTSCSNTAPMYCIAGICQKFSCSERNDADYNLKPSDCERETEYTHTTTSSSRSSSGPWRRAVGGAWRPASGCHYHCVSPGSGVRLVRPVAGGSSNSIQLCAPDERGARLGCSQKKTPFQYATMVCSKYKDRVRRLSGLGMQISPALEEPDRPCRIACQDERVAHRFYLVNGHDGWFPLGTACGNHTAYCVSGKCLEFGPDNTPLPEMSFTLPLISRANLTRPLARQRARRSLSVAHRVTATLTEQSLRDIIDHLNITENDEDSIGYFKPILDTIQLDFNNPIHVSPEESLLRESAFPV